MNSSPITETASPPDMSALDAAARRLRGVIAETPLLESPLLNRDLGFRLLVKAECLQVTGSFKIRGAYNMMARLRDRGAGANVVAFSSGNHAQAVAAAARMLGLNATIVMPADAPALKTANTRAWGAEVVTYDRHNEDREAIGRTLATDRGADLVPPFDHPDIIAGQGTLGPEILAQSQAIGAKPDRVLAPCSGGGLTSGIGISLAALSPGIRVHPVEPAGFDDTARSLTAGHRVANEPGARSACDALLLVEPGRLTFPILAGLHDRGTLGDGLVVDDGAVATAMRTALTHFKIVVEPGGAAALAAALQQRDAWQGQTVVVVCSGGNVDATLFARMVGADQTP